MSNGISGRGFPRSGTAFPSAGGREKIFPRGAPVRRGLARAKQCGAHRSPPSGRHATSNVPTPLVSFSIRDAYLPQPQELLFALHGDEILQGRVIDYSDGGAGGATYAVLAVEGVPQTIIVPLEKLRTNCE
jgi:hypothetical protein